jgi:hypothetical protein
MTIEELNKLIAEELKAYLNENEDEDMDTPEADGDDDIEVTTDEPDVEDGEEAMDLLRQIYDMIRPQVEPEGEEEPEMDMDMGDEEEGGDDDGEEEEELEEGVLNESLYVTAEELQTTLELAQQFGFTSPEAFHKALLAATGPAFLTIIVLAQLAHNGVKAVIPKLGKAIKGLKANAGKKDVASGVVDEDEGGEASIEDMVDTLNTKLQKIANVREAVDNHTFFRGDNVGRTVVKAKDVQGTREKASLKEGFDGASRFQKLANIKK